MKKEHYNRYDDDEERLKNKPETISVEEFKVPLNYWGDDEIKVHRHLYIYHSLICTFTSEYSNFKFP